VPLPTRIARRVTCQRLRYRRRISSSRIITFALFGPERSIPVSNGFVYGLSMKGFWLVIIIGLVLASFQTRPEQPVQRVTFAEVPASQSKISWVHDNGRSELRHLPETCGGGGLFFDFNNDGWMDIYLVNSGPSDFYTPKTPIKNALYRNNGDGTFVDVTDKAGV